MSELTRIIGLLYKMQEADTKSLEDQILEHRKRVWVSTLRELAHKYGCNKTPNAPRREDLRELKAMSKEDAKSISKTWNRDAERQIEKLYAANPRGNRRYYAKNMEAWAAERGKWKNPQIAITTETQTVTYAQRRFIEMNLTGKRLYKFSGPAPTCEDCTRRFAAGIVDEAYIKRYPCPRHPGCPHQWEVVNGPRKLNCATIWLG